MIILDATTRSLEIDLNAVVTANQLPFVASYVDVSQSTFAMSAMSSNTGTSNDTTAVTLVAAPGATTSRQLKYLSVKNSDTAAVLLWIQMNDNSTLREIWKGTLAVGDSLVYTNASGFVVMNSSGQIKTTTATAGIGTIGSSTDNSLVRWDGTGGTNVQNSGWTLTDGDVLTAAGNVSLGANYISRTGTAAGFSLDASNNATLSGTLTVSGASITVSAGFMQAGARNQFTSSGRISVSTATTIFTHATGGSSVGRSGALVVVNGYEIATPTNTFIDLVLVQSGQTPVTVSQSTTGASSRTYTSSGAALQLAMGSGTYNVSSSWIEQAN